MKKRNSQNGGFLLIEMLVAVFLFTLVMFVSISAVIALIDTNRKNQNMKMVVDNLTLVASSISKNVAVGSKYICGIAEESYLENYTGGDCGSQPADGITFQYNEDGDGDGDLDVYRYYFLATDVDDQGNSYGTVYRKINDQSEMAITAPNVRITRFDIYIHGTEPLLVPKDGGAATGDVNQPRVMMVVEGYTGLRLTERSAFKIETTVSQRSLDVEYID